MYRIILFTVMGILCACGSRQIDLVQDINHKLHHMEIDGVEFKTQCYRTQDNHGITEFRLSMRGVGNIGFGEAIGSWFKSANVISKQYKTVIDPSYFSDQPITDGVANEYVLKVPLVFLEKM